MNDQWLIDSKSKRKNLEKRVSSRSPSPISSVAPHHHSQPYQSRPPSFPKAYSSQSSIPKPSIPQPSIQQHLSPQVSVPLDSVSHHSPQTTHPSSQQHHSPRSRFPIQSNHDHVFLMPKIIDYPTESPREDGKGSYFRRQNSILTRKVEALEKLLAQQDRKAVITCHTEKLGYDTDGVCGQSRYSEAISVSVAANRLNRYRERLYAEMLKSAELSDQIDKERKKAAELEAHLTAKNNVCEEECQKLQSQMSLLKIDLENHRAQAQYHKAVSDHLSSKTMRLETTLTNKEKEYQEQLTIFDEIMKDSSQKITSILNLFAQKEEEWIQLNESLISKIDGFSGIIKRLKLSFKEEFDAKTKSFTTEMIIQRQLYLKKQDELKLSQTRLEKEYKEKLDELSKEIDSLKRKEESFIRDLSSKDLEIGRRKDEIEDLKSKNEKAVKDLTLTFAKDRNAWNSDHNRLQNELKDAQAKLTECRTKNIQNTQIIQDMTAKQEQFKQEKKEILKQMRALGAPSSKIAQLRRRDQSMFDYGEEEEDENEKDEKSREWERQRKERELQQRKEDQEWKDQIFKMNRLLRMRDKEHLGGRPSALASSSSHSFASAQGIPKTDHTSSIPALSVDWRKDPLKSFWESQDYSRWKIGGIADGDIISDRKPHQKSKDHHSSPPFQKERDLKYIGKRKLKPESEERIEETSETGDYLLRLKKLAEDAETLLNDSKF
ncbi:hypothetical protein ADUPG1_013213 [Aduncisulcus paluster]|uniref:Uncharacterized protein n=1 Tax=Aduncisulcus paluster TaxID=2918883 RepID=A0ABQ5K254_9EUKA|nr:hypothetical protein ADUPG1_013213 [Aduncisulcus paluster]